METGHRLALFLIKRERQSEATRKMAGPLQIFSTCGLEREFREVEGTQESDFGQKWKRGSSGAIVESL